MTLFSVELSTWWTVAEYAAPLILGTALALWAMAAYMQAPSPRAAALVLAAFAICVLSTTRGALALILVWGLAAAVPVGQATPRGFVGATRRYWKLWAACAGVATFGVIFLLAGTNAAVSPVLSVSGTYDFVSGFLREAVVPSIWGGPWTWFTVSPENWPAWQVGPGPSVNARDFAAAALLLAVTAALLIRPVLWRWAVVSLGFMLASTVVVSLGLAGGFYPVAAMRFAYDFGIPLAILLALAICPTRWEREPYAPAVSREVRRWHTLPVVLRSGLALAAVVAFGASLAVSYGPPIGAVGNVFSRVWISNALATAPPQDQPLLEQVAPGLMGAGSANQLIGTFDGAPAFRTAVYGRLLGLSEDGKVEEQRVQGVSAPIGPWPECGYLVGTDPVEIPIQPANALNYTIEMGYGTTAPVMLEVQTGATTRLLELPAGRGTVFFGSASPMVPVRVKAIGAQTLACIPKFVAGARIGTGLDGPVEIVTIP